LSNILSTADICDRFLNAPAELQVLAPGLRSFGGRAVYMGQIATLSCTNRGGSVGLRDALCKPGHGRVLVVEAHANDSWALLGDQLASLGLANGWAGVVLNGYVRDVRALRDIDFGVHAIGTIPARPREFDPSNHDSPVEFLRVRFLPGNWLCADDDGIVVCEQDNSTISGPLPFFCD
jgi:regulator of ribonuclease activity A